MLPLVGVNILGSALMHLLTKKLINHLKNVNCSRGENIKTKEFKKMNLKTKIKSDTAPLLFFTMIDCQTFGELKNYLEKRSIRWEFAKQSETSNTVKINYKGHNLFHDFEIVN